MNEQEIERELNAKGLNAPRITLAHIESLVVRQEYHQFLLTTAIVCALTLKNGFVVVGESACASPENFDSEIGCKIARQKALDKVWELEGYLLKQKLYEASL